MTDKFFFRFRFPFSSFFKNDFTVTFCYISKLNWTYVQCGIVACSIRVIVTTVSIVVFTTQA